MDHLAHLCEQALHPNTEVVRAAVAQLNAALNDPQSTMLFLTLLQQSPHTHVSLLFFLLFLFSLLIHPSMLSMRSRKGNFTKYMKRNREKIDTDEKK